MDALCKRAHEYIVFPTSRRELLANKLQFNAIAGFPNIIGATDCTHVLIKAPVSHEDVNRKGVHMVNIQAVCDADMRRHTTLHMPRPTTSLKGALESWRAVSTASTDQLLCSAEKTCKIVVVVSVLHNICISRRLATAVDPDVLRHHNDILHGPAPNDQHHAANNNVRLFWLAAIFNYEKLANMLRNAKISFEN